MRAFIAIPVQASKAIKKALALLSSYGKPVEEQNLHITIKFLGEIDDVSYYANLLDSLSPIGPFSANIEGIAAFPNLNYIRVLYLKIPEPLQHQLAEHFKQINPSLPFHLTLARIKKKIPEKVLAELNAIDYGTIELSSVVLYKSVLSKQGPKYFKLKQAKL